MNSYPILKLFYTYNDTSNICNITTINGPNLKIFSETSNQHIINSQLEKCVYANKPIKYYEIIWNNYSILSYFYNDAERQFCLADLPKYCIQTTMLPGDIIRTKEVITSMIIKYLDTKNIKINIYNCYGKFENNITRDIAYYLIKYPQIYKYKIQKSLTDDNTTYNIIKLYTNNNINSKTILLFHIIMKTRNILYELLEIIYQYSEHQYNVININKTLEKLVLQGK